MLDFLAECLGVAPARIALIKGESGRRKTIIVEGIGVEEARRRLGLAPAP